MQRRQEMRESSIMAKATLLLLLLLVQLASASHFWGGKTTFSYKGRNPDGTLKVDIRKKSTFDECTRSSWFSYALHWSCYSGGCGYSRSSVRGNIDTSTNTPSYERSWCETETVTRRHVPDKPFSLRAASCCWIQTRYGYMSWRLLTHVDLGTRSDTGQPNRSPDISTLSFLRTPQNCPRSYHLLAFDADGDQVRCRYGTTVHTECAQCRSHSGFTLDEGSCMLHYNYASLDHRIFGFELMVEDYPQQPISLSYSDGSRSYRYPGSQRPRRRRQAWWPGWTTVSTTTASTPSTWAPHWPWWLHVAPTTPNPRHHFWPWHTVAAPAQTTRTSTTTGRTSTTTGRTSTTTGRTSTTTGRTSTTTRSTTSAQTFNWQNWNNWNHWNNWPLTTTASPWNNWNHWSNWPPTTVASPWPQNPLSKLPLQFSFLVDPPAPSCTVGLYLPRLVYPTPTHGARIHAEINKEVEVRVKAQASHATLQDIIFSGPLNATKHRTTHDEFIIKWTPITEDLGDHFTLCFAVEASASSRIYQSEMRCVVLDVKEEQVKTNVICTESTMRVEVEKASLRGLHESHLRLIDSTNTACDLQRYSNRTHVIGVFPLNSCGTTLEEDETNLIFKNEITTVDNLADVITRKHLLEVDFFCEYPKRGNVTLGFSVHRKNVTVWERGMGTFTYQFEFYPDNGFRTMINPNSYPLEFEVGTRIYMQIEATSSVNNTQLFVESCRAAPYDIPNYTPSYSIIENGCAVDMTVMMHNTNDNQQFRFSMEAFKFIGLHDQVYIQCSVMMCEAGNPNTRCARGCMNMRGRDKRDVAVQTASHFVSQGPLRLRRSADVSPATSGNLNLNLVFIAGCLLAVVGMISAVIMYKTKMATVKYQPLPSTEN